MSADCCSTLKYLGVEPVGAESYVYGIIGGERVVVRVPGRSRRRPTTICV